MTDLETFEKVIRDLPIAKIAKKNKTPFYVYDLDQIGRQVEALRKNLPAMTHIHYAMKANSNHEILKYFNRQGMGVDTVSGGEIQTAQAAGFKPEQIIFSGVGKSVDEISLALKLKIKLIIVESIPELQRIGTLAKKNKKVAHVAVRLNPDVSAKSHPYISTGSHINKFGLPFDAIPEIKSVLSKFKNQIRLHGLTFHIGSQMLFLEPLEQALQKTRPIFEDLRNQGFPLKYFDVGGGIGIRYKTSDKNISLPEYGAMIKRNVQGMNCEILCEPGRVLVGESGVLVTEVQYVKKTGNKQFLIVNTGMHHLLRPALYQAYHPILPVTNKGNIKETYEVVGPICESSDVLGDERVLPQQKEGDLLAILNAGAYGYSMASHYNQHVLPAEFIVSKGRVKLARSPVKPRLK